MISQVLAKRRALGQTYSELLDEIGERLSRPVEFGVLGEVVRQEFRMFVASIYDLLLNSRVSDINGVLSREC